MHLNLAPFRYPNLLKQPDGPIQKMNVLNVNDFTGRTIYEVQAYLNPRLKYHSVESSEFYGSCDATGTDRFLHIALWKAISESIERWSFHDLLKSETKRYGMDIDQTSTGFAAFPCWPKTQVRKIAFSEALERWAISNWWLGRLNSELLSKPLSQSNIRIVRLEIPELLGHVVVLFATEPASKRDFTYYGFAHGYSLQQAIRKASVELMRNRKVLLVSSTEDPKSISDQRLFYFSTTTGFNDFKDRINCRLEKSAPVPHLLIDEEIKGEWTKFATVWRCLLPETNYNWSSPKHFMF